jgi:hypothetical protein
LAILGSVPRPTPQVLKPKAMLVLNVFESKLRRIDMNFGQALEAVKRGGAMRLPSWFSDVEIRAQFPDEHSKMTAPYLYVVSRHELVPWKETMIELFSEEWEIKD